MSIPCRARCKNEKEGFCQLQDDRIRESQVEFGQDWDPVESCDRYLPKGKKEKSRKKR